MKLSISRFLFFALLGLCLSAPAEETTPLGKSKAVYTESIQKIETEHQAQLKPLGDAYYKSLMKILGKAKTDGDLDALKAIKAEEERFLKAKTVPLTPPSSLHAQIAKVQAGYNNTLSDVGQARDKKILRLLSHYIKRLEALKVAYVRKEDIKNAEAVDKVLDGAKDQYRLVRSGRESPVTQTPKIAVEVQVEQSKGKEIVDLLINGKWERRDTKNGPRKISTVFKENSEYYLMGFRKEPRMWELEGIDLISNVNGKFTYSEDGGPHFLGTGKYKHLGFYLVE